MGPNLPGLDGFLKARFEVPPPIHIVRVNATGLERLGSTAYLLHPELV
jgi:hypothetical protein